MPYEAYTKQKNVEQNSQYQLVYMCAPGEITAYSYEQEGDYNKI